MRLALARHDDLIRTAVEGQGGAVFKTIGDAFCAAFGTAPEAVTAALAAQTALLSEKWANGLTIRVRMALHSGEAEHRDNDYFGQAVNRVARLLAIGHGGQTLLSQSTWELIRDQLPPETRLRDLDMHRLKDLQRPEHVYQLLHPRLPSDFLPLRSLNPQTNNLPVQITSFVGREKEVREVKRLLQETRLLTLTGVGGAGKTRLALQVAADLLEGEGDGVWLVELAPIADPNLVVQAVMQTLGVREEAERSPTQTLADYLKERKLLLILDNCEHVLDSAASLADTLLRACPGVQIIATSREGLNIAGETTFRIPSLSVPDPETPLTNPEALVQYEAVRLFVERARSAQPAFAVSTQNAFAVAQICSRLDGIPFAIELASARVRALSPEQISARLDDRFRLLTGGSRTALPRQQTLRALIDWSYSLLAEPERTLLNRLSVFAGGWTLEAAEHVTVGEGIEDWEVLDLLSSLVDKSLVIFDEAGAGEVISRYRLLETVRQFSQEKLAESGESSLIRNQHRAWFQQFVEEASRHLAGPEQAQWFARMYADRDNLYSAIAWWVTVPPENEEERLACLRFIRGLHRFWERHGSLQLGRDQQRRLLEAAGPEPSGGPPSEAYVSAFQIGGILAQNAGDYAEALKIHRETLRLAEENGSVPLIVRAQGELAIVAQETGDDVGAMQYQKEAVELLRMLGSTHENELAIQLSNLGVSHLSLGYLTEARAELEEALAIQRRLGDTRSVSIALNNLGDLALDEGDVETALRQNQESLRLAHEIGARRSVAYVLESLLAVAVAQGNVTYAARLGGAAEALRERIGAPLPPSEQELYATRLLPVRNALTPEAFVAAWESGRTLPYEDAVRLGLE